MIHIGGRKVLPPQAIINMDADQNYTIITLTSGEKIMVATTLKKIESKVLSYKNFVRVNKSTILNTDYAQLEGKKFLLPNDKIVAFSRRKWKEYLNVMIANKTL